MREHDRVLDGLVAALSQGRRHGVRGVADQRDPAGVEGGQGLGDVVDVVAQDVLGAGGGEDGGDRVVPVAEGRGQFGRSSSVARPPAGTRAAAYA